MAHFGGIDYYQKNTASVCAAMVACSGLTLANTPSSTRLLQAAPGGQSEITVSHTGGTSGIAAIMHEIRPGVANLPASGYVPKGTWAVLMNVTTANANWTWQQIWICHIDASGCSNIATMGSRLAIGANLASTGVYSARCRVPNDTTLGSITETVYIVLGFSIAGAGSQSLGYTPDQQVYSPIGPEKAMTFGPSTLLLPNPLVAQAGVEQFTFDRDRVLTFGDDEDLDLAASLVEVGVVIPREGQGCTAGRTVLAAPSTGRTVLAGPSSGRIGSSTRATGRTILAAPSAGRTVFAAAGAGRVAT